MQIRKIGISSILPDNDTQYLHHIIKAISVIDEDGDLTISKTNSGYNFTLKHSDEALKDILLKQITAAHECIGLEAQFSSYKHSPFITFRLLAR